MSGWLGPRLASVSKFRSLANDNCPGVDIPDWTTATDSTSGLILDAVPEFTGRRSTVTDFYGCPLVTDPNRDRPMASLIPINRARSHPKDVAPKTLKVAARARHDGYELSGFVPAAGLTGYDPGGQPRVGIYYAVIDRELGWQTLSLGLEYPVTEDPSLWGEAVLT